jgi:hypothetical protein
VLPIAVGSWQKLRGIVGGSQIPTQRNVMNSDEGYLSPSGVRISWERSCDVNAGPVSGKTTAPALGILKLRFVNGLELHEIIATTFTHRAAAVLRSRIIKEWGDGIRPRILDRHVPCNQRFERFDFHQLRVGTIDSIAQELLNDFREAVVLLLPRPAITNASLKRSAVRFASVVGDIELAVLDEIRLGSTRPRPARPEGRTCTRCDFKYQVPLSGCDRQQSRALDTLRARLCLVGECLSNSQGVAG